jgi:hypothetical protein
MVVACLALFVALGSGAYAAVKLKPNSVKAKNIKAGAVTGPKIGSNAVSTGKIANDAVTAAKIANAAVTSPKLADLSVNNAKIGLDAVQTGKIANNAVTAAKIAPQAITKGKFVASGTATNTTTYNLTGPGDCALENTFAAPGVQPGDVIAYSFSTTVPAGELSAAPAEGTAGNNTISVEICENAGVLAAVTPGSLTLHWIAIR